MPAKQFVGWVGIHESKYFEWKKRYGKANEHNARIPRDHWLEAWEQKAIADFAREHPVDGYRRQTFMMLDQDMVAASPVTVWRVLKREGLLNPWKPSPTRKGNGFTQPERPHQHWHSDISYLNICGTFYYLCSVMDGYSRYIVHWEIREAMKERDVELIVQKAKEQFPEARPRLITDNGPQYIARDFKEFVRISGMDHVRTSPYYPQSNGKLERWHHSLKAEAIRPKTPLTVEDARSVVANFVEEYNTRRLHSALGYIAPKDKLEGRQEKIWTERDRKLEEARERRRIKRQQARQQAPAPP